MDNLDEVQLERHGGEAMPGGAGIRMKGWSFAVSEGPILNTSELRTLMKRLEASAGTPDAKLPVLPEGIFGHNQLSITHEASGRQVAFNVEGALRNWFKSSLEHGSAGLTVPAASLGSWREKVQEMGGEAVSRDFDWTYSTDYAGADGAGAGWAAHGGAGIDYAMLKKQDVPILFYADLPLYQDDLHDHGESELRLRLRVMPDCFFILLRHNLRVDGMLIKQRDTRYFHAFGQPSLLRQSRVAEAPLPPLKLASVEPPADGAVPADVHPAALAAGRGGPPAERPPAIVGVGVNAALPDEQKAAERLAALPPTFEATEEAALTAAA